MFIQTEETPNPNALKFLPGRDISPSEAVFFHTEDEARDKSDLACQLFQVEDVNAVFFGRDFITLTKTDDADWQLMKTEILTIINDHLLAELPIFHKTHNVSKPIDPESIPEIERQIIEIIDTRVRPSVAMDGGDIVYQSFDDGVVFLELKGACSGCPSSTITLKNGIESMLKHFVPEVRSVEAVPS